MPVGEFTRVLEIRQVLVVGDKSNRMGGALNILVPFSESKNNGEEFAVVNIIVSFSGKESAGEVGARVEVAVRVGLEKDSASGEQRGIGHDGKRASDIRDRKYGS